MHHRRNQIISIAKHFGLGVAFAAATFGQADAQIDFSVTDAIGSINAQHSVATADDSTQPTIQLVNRYQADQYGNLSGQATLTVGSTAPIQVSLLQNRQIIQQVNANSQGEFTLTDVRPGNYSVVVTGSGQMGARGLMVVGSSAGTSNTRLNISTIGTKYDGVQELVTKTLPAVIASHTERSPIQRVSANVSRSQVAEQVRIVNGKVRGQVASFIQRSNVQNVQVHLLQNDRPIAQVETDAQGIFTIPEVESGVYDLVAAGPAGFAAMQIEAIGPASPFTQVAYQAQIDSLVNVPLAEDCPCNQPANNAAVALEPASHEPIQYASESIGCGGACGACSGCGNNYSGVGGRVLGNRGALRGGSFRGGRFAGGGVGGGGFAGGPLSGGGFAGGGVGSAGFGGAGIGGAGALSRLLSLGALAGSIVAIADDDDAAPSSPTGTTN